VSAYLQSGAQPQIAAAAAQSAASAATSRPVGLYLVAAVVVIWLLYIASN
jgi:hypothetical protein